MMKINLFALFLLFFLSSCMFSESSPRRTISSTSNDSKNDENITGSRPNLEITLTQDCACKAGAPISRFNLNYCTTFCSAKNTANETLYLKTTLSVKALAKVANLYEWCNKELSDGIKNPSCLLIYEDSSGEQYEAPVTISASANSFSANIVDLDFDKPYKLRLKEISSNAATTDVAAFIKTTSTVKPDPLVYNTGAVFKVIRYACEITTNTNPVETFFFNFFTTALQSWNSYPKAEPVNCVSNGQVMNIDNTSMKIWKIPTGNQNLNTYVQQYLDFEGYDSGGVAIEPFKPQYWILKPPPNSISSNNPQGAATVLGRVLKPFLKKKINSTDYLGDCPTTYSTSGLSANEKILVNALKLFTKAAPTEAFYLARQSNDVPNYILVTQSWLLNASKTVYKDGPAYTMIDSGGTYAPKALTLATLAEVSEDESIYFNYNPGGALTANDFVEYRIVHYDEAIPDYVGPVPHDHRIGCTPK